MPDEKNLFCTVPAAACTRSLISTGKSHPLRDHKRCGNQSHPDLCEYHAAIRKGQQKAAQWPTLNLNLNGYRNTTGAFHRGE